MIKIKWLFIYIVQTRLTSQEASELLVTSIGWGYEKSRVEVVQFETDPVVT